MAPISIMMWKIWARFLDQKIKYYKKKPLNNIRILRAPIDLLHATPLTMFDHVKSTTLEVEFHTKHNFLIGHSFRKHL